MALLKRSSTSASAGAEDGRMTLMEHVRELRNRLVKMILAMVVGTIVGFAFFDPIWTFMTGPYCRLPAAYKITGGTECSLVVHGVLDGFFINLKVAAIFGAIVSAPIWLYQIWAFVTPGLYQNERRYSLAFLGLAVPLFGAGAALAYFTLDKGLSLLLGFVPDNAIALIDVGDYLGFLVMMLVIFGISFLMPLLMVFLNVVGILRFKTVAKHQRMVVFLLFVFAAVATPSQDPFTMLALAMPMVLLFFVAEGVMYLRDRKRDEEEAARAKALEEELDGGAPAASDDW
ncbi:twin-arginine translocase subunit TatC [Microtetraspora sp. NBRC 16547]|uniref:twin-arginine translocase subunit TatC n=1 Tax=Microtetraspora sp. NBRC 16547 TaxID=3030993 RepID=UPI0024A17F30|nr:twin-arginine translocase subunit TatC [Microtetraspora sp. NBRC 16547]GLW99666.1 Sec-independent protein translocase protein TatC [Microtetraspora sp. NBRC 16547]